MTRSESSIILTHCTTQEQILNCCRLIHTIDACNGNDVFSVFLSTYDEGMVDEEFVYDIARDKDTAMRFFNCLCREHVTACTLCDIARDFLAEA